MIKDLSIFIVDKDLISLELYRQYLLNLGYSSISLISDCEQCVQQLDKKPDIILLDHKAMMPDSLEIIRSIKRYNPDIYIIYILRNESKLSVLQALKHGAFDFIIKGSMDEEEMITRIMKRIVLARVHISVNASQST